MVPSAVDSPHKKYFGIFAAGSVCLNYSNHLQDDCVLMFSHAFGSEV